MNARLSLIVGCLLAVGLGIWASLAPQNEAARGVSQPLAAVTLLPSGKALPEFSLINKAGQSVGREAFLQRWSLVFLGFTHCGDICPLTMARMQLIQEAVNGAVEMVFISVDPGRDTPEIIRQYVENYAPDFQGMTGTPDELRKFAGAVGASFDVYEAPDRYTVNHSSALFLIGPETDLRGVITPPFDVPLIVQDLKALL